MSGSTTSRRFATNIIASGRSPSRRSRPARSTFIRNILRGPGPRLRFSGRARQARSQGDAAFGRAELHAGLVFQPAPAGVQGPAHSRGDHALLRFRMDQQECDVLVLQTGDVAFPEHRHGGQGQAGAGGAETAGALARQGSRRSVRRALSAAGFRRLGQRPDLVEARLRSSARGGLQARRLAVEAARRSTRSPSSSSTPRSCSSRTSRPGGRT